MTRPRIALIATGGTIDAVGTDRLDIAHYTETGRRLGDGELVTSLPEIDDLADVLAIPFDRVPSYALTTDHWAALATTVRDLARTGHDGVVITHGTNTLEETAFALSLTLDTPVPVVLTGAMRPASAIGADGPINLVRAVQVAASPRSRGRGVLVVLDDTVHAARHVTKTSTSRVSTFRSPDAGPVGHADADGAVVYHHGPDPAAPAATFDPGALARVPRVDVLVSHVGADGALVDAAVRAGARGLVSAGTGAGRPTATEDQAYDRAIAAGVVVVQASRTGSGRVARSPRSRARGVVACGDLQPWKARVLLALALTRTSDTEEIQDLFDRV